MGWAGGGWAVVEDWQVTSRILSTGNAFSDSRGHGQSSNIRLAWGALQAVPLPSTCPQTALGSIYLHYISPVLLSSPLAPLIQTPTTLQIPLSHILFTS